MPPKKPASVWHPTDRAVLVANCEIAVELCVTGCTVMNHAIPPLVTAMVALCEGSDNAVLVADYEKNHVLMIDVTRPEGSGGPPVTFPIAQGGKRRQPVCMIPLAAMGVASLPPVALSTYEGDILSMGKGHLEGDPVLGERLEKAGMSKTCNTAYIRNTIILSHCPMTDHPVLARVINGQLQIFDSQGPAFTKIFEASLKGLDGTCVSERSDGHLYIGGCPEVGLIKYTATPQPKIKTVGSTPIFSQPTSDSNQWTTQVLELTKALPNHVIIAHWPHYISVGSHDLTGVFKTTHTPSQATCCDIVELPSARVLVSDYKSVTEFDPISFAWGRVVHSGGSQLSGMIHIDRRTRAELIEARQQEM